MLKNMKIGVGALALCVLAGCAAPPPASDTEAMSEYRQTNDPVEPGNRSVFAFNQGFDKYLLKPVAEGYRDYVPYDLRMRIRDFLTNLSEPLVAVNDVFQGEFGRAGQSTFRFIINCGIGFFGIVDVAGQAGLEHHDEDFGQTLAVWGVPEGPYVMLPILGPSNPRDAVGKVVDYFIDPVSLWGPDVPDLAEYSKAGVGGVDKREHYIDALNDIERSSLDFYASMRTLYRQKRNDEIRNGKGNLPSPGFTFEPDEPKMSAN